MDNLDTREWLLTNGLGSMSSGTVCDVRTRIYHGWLIVALNPPCARTLLLSHFDASLEVAGQVWALSTNFWDGNKIDPLGYRLLRSFEIEPVPTWVWSQDNWQLLRQIVMPYSSGRNKAIGEINLQSANPQFCNRILIQYRYQGNEAAVLRLRPIIGDRDFHHQESARSGVQFSQVVGHQQICLQAHRSGWVGTPWHLRWSTGHYQPEGVWYWNYYYPEENRRGLSDREDLYSPGYLTMTLQPKDALTIEARVGWPLGEQPNLNRWDFELAVQAEEKRLSQLFDAGRKESRESTVAFGEQRESFSQNSPPTSAALSNRESQNPKSVWRSLLKASDQFIVYRASVDGPSVIAGYPWFRDWGRVTLIALPGLALATGRFTLARELLETLGRCCHFGLIPNTFSNGGTKPIYNSIDAALWWIETLGLYLEATQDWAFLGEQYPIVRQIYKSFSAGTLYNINVDAIDGLVTWEAPNVAITWMDAVIDGQPITPRCGKPIEINALWYSALCWASQWAEHLATCSQLESVRLSNQAQRYAQQAKQVKASLQKFWNPTLGYFYDRIEPDDQPDSKIRPNAVLALSLYHCGFPAYQARSVLQVARERLLTPYGLRSLDPSDPAYEGRYGGDQLARDRAYHQGTVWSWLIGPFIRASLRFPDAESFLFDWNPLLEHFFGQACIGSVSEIFDGDPPHYPKGAIAQAWSVAELIRHYPP